MSMSFILSNQQALSECSNRVLLSTQISNPLIHHYEDCRPYNSKKELYKLLLFIINDVNQSYKLHVQINIKQLINTYTDFFNESFDLHLFIHFFSNIANQLYKVNILQDLNLTEIDLQHELLLLENNCCVKFQAPQTSFGINYFHNKNRNLLHDLAKDINNQESNKSMPLLSLLKSTYITDTAYTLMLHYKWQFNNRHIIYMHLYTQIQQAIYSSLVAKSIKSSMPEWINYGFTRRLFDLSFCMKHNFANKLYSTLDNLKLQEKEEKKVDVR